MAVAVERGMLLLQKPLLVLILLVLLKPLLLLTLYRLLLHRQPQTIGPPLPTQTQSLPALARAQSPQRVTFHSSFQAHSYSTEALLEGY